MEDKKPRYERSERANCVYHLIADDYPADGDTFGIEKDRARDAAEKLVDRGEHEGGALAFANAFNSYGPGISHEIGTGRLWAFPMWHARDAEMGTVSIGFEVHTGSNVVPGTFDDLNGEIVFLGWCDVKEEAETAGD